MIQEQIWSNRRLEEGPCSGCPGTSMGYPVYMGPPRSPVCILARDPNYTFGDNPEAKKINEELRRKLDDGEPWERIQSDMRRCRSIDPKNKLRKVYKIVEDTCSVDVYFTNVAKCGSRGAYGEPNGGQRRDRIKHCRSYLEDELALAGTHTTISFGSHARDALARAFEIPAPGRVTVDGQFLRAGGRHLIIFRHWSRAPGEFHDSVRQQLRDHFECNPVVPKTSR